MNVMIEISDKKRGDSRSHFDLFLYKLNECSDVELEGLAELYSIIDLAALKGEDKPKFFSIEQWEEIKSRTKEEVIRLKELRSTWK